MPRITRPQVYRVVPVQLLPKERFGPERTCMLWLTDVQERNERFARRSHQKRRAALGRNTSRPPSMNRR